MRILPLLLASACALAFAAPASAQFAATLNTGYSHVSLDQGGGDINVWDIGGQAAATIPGTGFNIQGDLGYNNLSGSGDSGNSWSGGGAAFWADDMLRAGATANYDGFNGGGSGTVHITNYGGFGEWFAGMMTVGVKGGGLNLSVNQGGISGSTTGAYVGGEVVGYAMPDLALTGTIDYTDLSHGVHETDFTPQAEWLFSEDLPIAVYGGYTFSHVVIANSGSGNANTFFIGLRLYVNGNGSAALIDRQRTGTVGWGTAFSPLARAL
ncbi:MAG TPA: hypothetical protein VIJ62_00180 [Rhizomicrobium sp.]